MASNAASVHGGAAAVERRAATWRGGDEVRSDKELRCRLVVYTEARGPVLRKGWASARSRCRPAISRSYVPKVIAH